MTTNTKLTTYEEGYKLAKSVIRGDRTVATLMWKLYTLNDDLAFGEAARGVRAACNEVRYQ